jgi:hypothetical protein
MTFKPFTQRNLKPYQNCMSENTLNDEEKGSSYSEFPQTNILWLRNGSEVGYFSTMAIQNHGVFVSWFSCFGMDSCFEAIALCIQWWPIIWGLWMRSEEVHECVSYIFTIFDRKGPDNKSRSESFGFLLISRVQGTSRKKGTYAYLRFRVWRTRCKHLNYTSIRSWI